MKITCDCPLSGSVMVTGWLIDWRCLHLYRDVRTGVVLARSSQPEVGWLGWRNTQDESLLHAIAESCALHRGGSTITSELNHVDSISSVVPSELYKWCWLFDAVVYSELLFHLQLLQFCRVVSAISPELSLFQCFTLWRFRTSDVETKKCF